MGRGSVATKSISFRMPSVLFCVKATTVSPWTSPRSQGEEGLVSGGVLHHGTLERGQPSNLGGPRFSSIRLRSCGEPVIRLRRAARRQGQAQPVQNKPRHRGRSSARGTEVATDGGEEVGGLHTSVDIGERGGAWTRSSKGGPCWCELQEGTMTNASTFGKHVPETLEVSGR